MKFSKQSIIFFFILVGISTLVKLICAPQINFGGFTAIIAVSLFAGISIRDTKLTFLFPLLAVFISDVLLQALHAMNLFPFAGFYSGQLANYALIVIVTLIGMAFRGLKTAGIIVAAVAAPTIFFLLSNFFVWKFQADAIGYNKDISGLWQTYTFGLPFYRNSLISTFIFLPAFIALYNRMMYGKFELAHAMN
jgi:hypothetical protein